MTNNNHLNNINNFQTKQFNNFIATIKSERFIKTCKIGFKIIAALGMLAGGVTALGGAYLLTKATLVSPFVTPLFLIGAVAGFGAIHLTKEAWAHPFSCFLIAVTIPTAGFCFSLPITLPILIGILPGVGLCNLSNWAWEKITI